MAANTRRIAIALAIGAAFLLQTGALVAEEKFDYVGAKKCSMCHKKAATGAQYKKWLETSHANAFETLGTPEALEAAKKAGVEGNPQEAAACMKCHSTAWGMSAEALAASKITLKEGVSCESCHGPGSAYAPKKVMQKITDGTLDGTTVGLMTPDEAVCRGCHNEESPTFESFDFKKAYAKVAHPNPEKAAAK